ncbi:MAG: GxxExxY protein [Patescibacteria group bacterium]
MAELIYPKLSYEIIGSAFEVYNSIGSGFQEKYYQKALAKELEEKKIKFREQLPVRISHKGIDLGMYYFDFLVDNKIIVKLKNSSKFYTKDIKQVLGYLLTKDIKLGILICFSKNGLIYKRILKGNSR